MRVLTWNVWARNERYRDVYSFIKRDGFDFICLQEVTEPLLQMIEDDGSWSIFTHEDTFGLTHKRKKKCRMAILARNEFFVEKAGDIEAQGFHYIEARRGRERIKIINAHMENTLSPAARLKQLDSIMRRHVDGRTILCGDFNAFGRKWLKPVLMLFERIHSGSSRADEYGMHEKRSLLELVRRYGFQDVSCGKITYPGFLMQLDFIIAPDSRVIKERSISRKTYGSDHSPIWVDIELDK
ncbi:endonuclease/exonuclease/phosphatase family protein [bacterium]|nr:endonuclease/exonuclease/phosphatase family protein [bacterium]